MAQKVAVCPVEALEDGEMRQFSVADREVLLARFEGEFWAIAPKCTHAGAKLADGVMTNGHVVCPWHHACFSLRSGQMLEPPALNDLAQYPTSIEADTVYVELSNLKESNIEESKVPELANQKSDDRTFIIIGGGAAGCAAAQMLRQVKLEGRIVLITASEEPPYDRTKLSKAYLQQDQVDDPDLLRPISFYQRYDIALKTAAKVTRLDAKAQTITYGEGGIYSVRHLAARYGGCR